MKTRALLVVAATLLVLGAAAGVARSGPKPAASASAALPSLPALWDPDRLQPLAAIPEEKSKAPTAAEWKTAEPVRLARVAPSLRSCNAYRVREWLKVHCDLLLAGVRLVAGSSEGVAMWVVPREAGSGFTNARGGEVIFPLRRGDRRVFEIFALEFDWETPTSASIGFLDERWLPTEATPTVQAVAR